MNATELARYWHNFRYTTTAEKPVLQPNDSLKKTVTLERYQMANVSSDDLALSYNVANRWPVG
jgi:hypothetical protein